MTEDERNDDIPCDEYEPVTGESASWLAMLDEEEATFREYNEACDRIGKTYADLNILRSTARKRQFQLLWSTTEVIKPSVYSRPPEPVVVPRFKDRRPLYRVASEVLERSVKVEFDLQAIDDAMTRVRDDLVLFNRGVAWCRYESDDGDKVCMETVDRRDFRHESARNWSEVGWVGRRCWMTYEEMRKRFSKHSGDAYLGGALKVMREAKEQGGATKQEKCPVWEIWSKTEKKVVWVTEGVDVTLDEGPPHLKLESFFPCPRPAYGTVQPGGMMPVPDYLFYKDQAEEVNQITNRIHALADAVKVRGFYAAGAGEASAALERAIQMEDDNLILIGINNLAQFGTTARGDVIQWMPLEVIGQTIAQLLEFRRQLLDDVYQIVGIADIMRGSSEKTETATAQRLKAQAGSVRIRDKQGELVRFARDLVRITAEIIAENFPQKAVFEMSQMDTPTDADIAKRVKEIKTQAKQVQDQAEQQAQQMIAQAQQAMQQAAQQPPQEGQPNPQEQVQQQISQLDQQVTQQLDALQQQLVEADETVTQEEVMKFLRDQKIRPFVLDVESDSTIQADEDAEKQRRNEFVQVFGQLMGTIAPALEQMPQLGPMLGEVMKFGLAPYRVGRELEGTIDEGIEAVLKKSQDPQEDPEAEAARAEAEKVKGEQALAAEKFKAEQQAAAEDRQIKMAQLQLEAQKSQQSTELEQLKQQADLQIKQLEAENRRLEIVASQQRSEAESMKTQQAMAINAQKHEMDMAKGAQDMRNKAMTTDMNVQATAAKTAASMQKPKNQDGL